MGRALIIGAGGVSSVIMHKCCQNSEVFEEICIASRTKSKCDALKQKLIGDKTKVTTAQVDADSVEQLLTLIKEYQTRCCNQRSFTLSRFNDYGCLSSF